jgi:hypothetical protein
VPYAYFVYRKLTFRAKNDAPRIFVACADSTLEIFFLNSYLDNCLREAFVLDLLANTSRSTDVWNLQIQCMLGIREQFTAPWYQTSDLPSCLCLLCAFACRRVSCNQSDKFCAQFAALQQAIQ